MELRIKDVLKEKKSDRCITCRNDRDNPAKYE